MKSTLTYRKLKENKYDITFNKTWLGQLISHVDSPFEYYPPHKHWMESYPSWVLKDIADKLDELNDE